MFKNYLKIALRNMARQKTFTFINIAGVAVRMTCTILIKLWVQDELSYDRFHINADDIFDTLLEATVVIENWRREYNQRRPHSSLGYRPPAPEAFEAEKFTLGVVH